MQTNIANRESRQYERITPGKAEPVIIDINGANFIDILTVGNISLGGVSVVVAHGFKGCEIAQQVRLVIKLPVPVNQSFSAAGAIKHVSGDAFGVEFISMHKQAEQMLRKYILFQQVHNASRKPIWKSIRYFCHLY